VLEVLFGSNSLEKFMARVSIILLLPIPFIPMCPAVESPLMVGKHATLVTGPLDMAPHDDDHEGERNPWPPVRIYASTQTSLSATTSYALGPFPLPRR
jgi:hypothetical protein